MEKEELIKILDNCESAVVNMAILDKYRCLMIPEEKWEAVTTALHNEVGAEGWQTEWDY